MRGLILGVATLWFVASGCGEGLPASGPAEVDTLASGRVTVRNTAGGIWTSDTRWSLVEDLRLGSLGGAGPTQFGRIDGLIADPSGRIYVHDGIAQEVRVFGPDGAHLFTLGGAGQGPREFGGVVGLLISPVGNLWVVDAGNNRYAEYDREGELVAIHPRTVSSFASISPSFLPDGALLEWAAAPRAGEIRAWESVRFTPPATFDTLAAVEYRFGTVGNGAAMTAWNQSLTGAPDRDGSVWVSPMNEYVIHRISLAGDTILSLTRPFRPVSVSRAERDSVVEFFGQFGLDIDPSDIPDEKLVVQRLVPDRSGHLYVVPHEVGVDVASVLDVFRDDGQYLGRIPLPEPGDVRPDQPSPFAGQGHIYLRVADPNGAHYVTRLRIDRP